MNATSRFYGSPGFKPWLTLAVLATLLAGCGSGDSGGRDPILGGPGGDARLAPTVIAVTPLNGATGVPINNPMVTATFSEPVRPISGSSSFTLTCAAPCVSPAGTITLDAAGRVATFNLAAGAGLAPTTLYTATVTGATSVATGLSMANPYVWTFTTGVAPDVTRPRVVSTEPATTIPGPTPGVPTNTAITATFSEEMAPATITGTSFTVTCNAPCVAPAGVVSYAVGSRTAVFTPAAILAPATTYTARITQAATDVAGNALAGNQAPLPAASDYVWTFTTAAAPLPPASISVLSTSPSAGSSSACPDASISATFTVPSGTRMDPLSIGASTFTLAGPGTTPVTASTITLDAGTGRIATFQPSNPLTAGATYTATIKGGATGVKDLAIPANTLVMDYTWSFTVDAGGCQVPNPPLLGSADPFGVFGGSAGMTNQGLLTVVNGDIGTTAVSTAVTGFHDAGPGCTYTETPLNAGIVNGKIYTAAPPPTPQCPTEGTAATMAVATQARADALTAYNDLVARPPGLDPGAGNLANLVLAPGTYTAAAGSFMIQGGNLTLDAQGDPNAVWVFQMATSLTVGGPGAAFPQSVILVNGAQADNVYWQVGSAATINAGGGGTMVGTVITQAGVAVSTPGNVTPVIVDGRLLSLGASVTLVNTIINVPGQ
ncbi:MAG: ice-binding family protein [Rhizobium sp.]|nr:ice-binding family protein [Rhizobium sp.]